MAEEQCKSRKKTSTSNATSKSLKNRVVARSEMGTAFYLFSHQVGGHKPFLRKAPGEVCKPAIPTETKFYATTCLENSALTPFVPKYLGTINVDLSLFDEHHQQRPDELCSSPTVCDAITSSSSSSTSVHSAASDVNSPITKENKNKYITPAKRKRSRSATPQPAEFSFRLWNKYSEKQHQLMQQSNTHEDGSTSLTANNNTSWICEYIVLEDLTQGYHRPCVLDIKMGTRQHGKFASPAKVESHTRKCKDTTSFDLGLRLCGMQIFQVLDRQYLLKDKHWGRSLQAADIQPALELFFNNGNTLRIDALKQLAERLKMLEKAIQSLSGSRFWGASLLLIYEGNTTKPLKVDIRIIDFANYYKDPTTLEPDVGYLKGIRNLLRYFDKIIAGFETCGGGGASDHPSDVGCYLDVFPDE